MRNGENAIGIDSNGPFIIKTSGTSPYRYEIPTNGNGTPIDWKDYQ